MWQLVIGDTDYANSSGDGKEPQQLVWSSTVVINLTALKRVLSPVMGKS